jgi:TonB-dependent starch-binding outer membrane protein SusC
MKKSTPHRRFEAPLLLFKLVLAMKFTLFLTVFCICQAHANVYGQRNITLNLHNTEIGKVLREIEQKGEFRFLYNYDLQSLKKKVDIRVENSPISETLEKLFINTDLTYKLLANNLVVVHSRNAGMNIQVNVSGKVTGENNEPLADVSVKEKGTNNGTITNAEGRYELTVSDNATLEISYVGYVTQEIQVRGQTAIDIKLVQSASRLDEVVVIGYGTQRRSDVTGAIATVSAKDIQDRPLFSAAQALQGKAAGVQVLQPSGKPGTDFSVRIRGFSSINASNDPLYVIDGIPTTDTRGLNTADIENIQILKDAASASIYGARAANGVVLITTKRGKANRSLVGLSTYTGFSKLINSIEILNTAQYRELMDEVLGAGTVDPSITNTTDWEDEVYRTGVNQNFQVNLSGGSEKTQYFLSAGYLKDKGIINPSQFDRHSVRLNVDNKVTDWLKVSANINYIRNYTRNTQDNLSSGRGGVILSALNTPPFLNVYKDDGSGQFDPNPFQPSWENPVAYMIGPTEKTRDNRLLANGTAEVTFFRGFSYKTNVAIDMYNRHYTFFIDPVRTNFGRQENGIARDERFNNFTWIWENTLNYNRSFGDHSINVLGGIAAQEFRSDYAYIEGKDFPKTANVQTISAANQIVTANTTAEEVSLVSNFARLMYNFDSRYLLTAAFRYDGSSKLAEGNKWDFFPSVSAGWRISAEKFMENANFINDLKLRIGWGQNGNQEGIGAYQSFGAISFVRRPPNTPLDGPAQVPTQIANPDLRWEKTTQTNIGLDVAFLNSRVSLTADVYWKKTDHLLLNVPLGGSTGFDFFTRNDGVLENKGLEIAISSRNTVTEFIWNTDFNIAFNTNKIVDFGLNDIYDFATVYSNNQQAIRATIGQPLGAFFGYVYEGVDPATGNAIYADLNKNGVVTPDDRTFIGYALPKFIFGLTNNFSYKNFDLNIFFQGVQGNDIFNATRVDLEGMFDSKNQSTAVLNRWKTAGQQTNIPRAGDINNVRNSTRFIEDGSFIRLKNVTLSYNFPRTLIQRLKMQRLALYVTGQNLLTITNYSGFDPEVNAYGTSSRGTEIGVDYGTYPQTRTIVFGLNVEF